MDYDLSHPEQRDFIIFHPQLWICLGRSDGSPGTYEESWVICWSHSYPFGMYQGMDWRIHAEKPSPIFCIPSPTGKHERKATFQSPEEGPQHPYWSPGCHQFPHKPAWSGVPPKYSGRDLSFMHSSVQLFSLLTGHFMAKGEMRVCFSLVVKKSKCSRNLSIIICKPNTISFAGINYLLTCVSQNRSANVGNMNVICNVVQIYQKPVKRVSGFQG